MPTTNKKKRSLDNLSNNELNSCSNNDDDDNINQDGHKVKKNKFVNSDDWEDIEYDQTLIPKRNSSGELVFKDYPKFRPNLTPKEVIQKGSFGGTYFRPIYSGVINRMICPDEAMRGLPAQWFEGVDVEKMVTSDTYDTKVNKYKVKCGQGLKEWEMSGWITQHDPYGWFQWYCHFYLGRRCPDDARQISRGMGVMGENGRWRRFLANKCLQSGKPMDVALQDLSISPKVRQLLQHWGYEITLDALKLAKKMS